MSTEAGVTMGSVRLTVLCDNHAARPGLAPAHGFSVLVETEDRRVLFDTGTDARTVENVDALGVSLSGLDAIVLSHGHYDHVGGLEAVLRRSGRVPVLAHPDLFRRAYVRDEHGTARYIGAPLSKEQYAELGADFCDEGERDILGAQLASVRQAQFGGTPTRLRQQFVRESESGLVPDAFSEEASLVVRAGGTSLVITGCAHRGPVELLRGLREGQMEGDGLGLLGGLHLGAHRADEIRRLGLRIHALGVTRLLPCHCTTECASAVLVESFLGSVELPGAGSVIEITSDGAIALMHPWVPCEPCNSVLPNRERM